MRATDQVMLSGKDRCKSGNRETSSVVTILIVYCWVIGCFNNFFFFFLVDSRLTSATLIWLQGTFIGMQWKGGNKWGLWR